MILRIAARELKGLFLSPLAWSILAVVQPITASIFLYLIDVFEEDIVPGYAGIPGAPGATDFIVARLFDYTASILLLITPLITMRILSEEKRSRTLSLLMSAPVSMTEIVLGKYLGVLGFFLAPLCMLALMASSLIVGTELDLGKFASGMLGLMLLISAFAAAGLYMSSLTEQPAIAAVSSLGLLLLMSIISLAGNSDTTISGLFSYLSLTQHFDSFIKGLFNSADVVYYLLFILTFLIFSIQRLDANRLPH